MQPAPTSQPSTEVQFPRLSRWLDMFDEIRATDPNAEK